MDKMIENERDKGRRFQILGMSHMMDYRKSRKIEDIDAAIRNYEEALDATPFDHPDRGYRLHALAVGYQARCHTLAMVEDLDLAVKKFLICLETPANDDAERAYRLRGLAMALQDKYQMSGQLKYIETAIKLFEEALELTPDNHLYRLHHLESLGNAYLHKYLKVGEEKDLEAAIQRSEEGFALTSTHNLLGRETGFEPVDRFHDEDQVKAKEGIEPVIQSQRNTLELEPISYLGQGYLFRVFGVGVYYKYRKTYQVPYLHIAIERLQQTLRLLKYDDIGTSRCLHDIAVAYQDIYFRKNDQRNFENTIEQYTKALHASPKDGIFRYRPLRGLGATHRIHSRREKSLESLNMAIKNHQAALDALPFDHPDRATILGSLGGEYKEKYEKTGQTTDYEMSLKNLRQSIAHPTYPIVDQIAEIDQLFQMQAKSKDWPAAYEAACVAMSRFSFITPDFMSNTDKQYVLANWMNIASNAAAFAQMSGKPTYEALSMIEQARGIMMSSLYNLSTDLSSLQNAHPQLAARFIRLRDELYFRTNLTQVPVNYYHDKANLLDETLHAIRKLPEFNRFLLPLSEDQMKAAAADGPIITINVSDYRCDAFIIDKGQLHSLHLPHLHKADILARADRLSTTEADMELLEWLWDTIAKPVLDVLELIDTPSADSIWPRLWWIPTGNLGKFPIHAAGYHLPGSTESVLDRAISSYSYSVKALLFSRQKRSVARTLQHVQSPKKAVLIAMEELHYAPLEIDMVEGHCRSMNLQPTRPKNHRKEVVDSLHECAVLHFAGHGLTNESDPSESALLLRDGPLSTAALLKSNLHHDPPFLAYLSACGTGQIMGTGHTDQGVHLVAGCQLVGFSNVIGTLWRVDDKKCTFIASETYRWIDSQGMNDRSVSEGLHLSIRGFRDQWILDDNKNTYRGVDASKENGMSTENASPIAERQATTSRNIVFCDDAPPLHWIPYVHFGI